MPANSPTDTALHAFDEAGRPVRQAIRRLRWFAGAFREQVARTSAATGVQFARDDAKTTAVFLDWVRAFDAQKPANPQDRRGYVGFAAGLMLRALIQQNPLSVVARPTQDDAETPASFWPEGYVYVAFCLNVRAAVLAQDFHEDQRLAPELTELRAWWSFRENVAEDPARSMAFLALFAGEDPDWTMSEVFRPAEARQILARFQAPKLGG